MTEVAGYYHQVKDIDRVSLLTSPVSLVAGFCYCHRALHRCGKSLHLLESLGHGLIASDTVKEITGEEERMIMEKKDNGIR
ncbi:MAG: hypothetical protein QGI86_18365 [Candidatus Poribacteria bacterium]|nr:hypothetical protein [Candidatus Poribacteria bacterium]MDP6749440.1 hypothetical protein [Candidatus Poribacteria bacterium]MDP6999401.1 hypothetical protein [Candidatus Poribacteria bacterium]